MPKLSKKQRDQVARELHRTDMIANGRLPRLDASYLTLLEECCRLYDEQVERLEYVRRKIYVPRGRAA
jgi:hypothetical protein